MKKEINELFSRGDNRIVKNHSTTKSHRKKKHKSYTDISTNRKTASRNSNVSVKHNKQSPGRAKDNIKRTNKLWKKKRQKSKLINQMIIIHPSNQINQKHQGTTLIKEKTKEEEKLYPT